MDVQYTSSDLRSQVLQDLYFGCRRPLVLPLCHWFFVYVLLGWPSITAWIISWSLFFALVGYCSLFKFYLFVFSFFPVHESFSQSFSLTPGKKIFDCFLNCLHWDSWWELFSWLLVLYFLSCLFSYCIVVILCSLSKVVEFVFSLLEDYISCE